MEWKADPFDLDGIGCLNFFNTPGNEVAPGSDEIGKEFESDELGHGWLRLRFRIRG
jgi:hypothetical protein